MPIGDSIGKAKLCCPVCAVHTQKMIEVARSYAKQSSHPSMEGMKIAKTMTAATAASLWLQRMKYSQPSLMQGIMPNPSCQTSAFNSCN